MTSPECCPGTLTNNGGKGEVCPAFGNPVPKHPTGTPLAAQNGLKAGSATCGDAMHPGSDKCDT